MAGHPFDDLGDVVDVDHEQQAANHPCPAADETQREAVAEEDAHHAAAGGAEGLEDADVLGFLDHDHEERGQDAEAGHRDDQEQQDVEERGLHLHGGEERALHVSPGLDAVGVFFGGEPCPQLVADGIEVRAGAELELDGRYGVGHTARFLQGFQRDEDKAAVVLTHLAFVEVNHGELLVEGLRLLAGGGEGDGHVVPRAAEIVVLDLPLGIPLLDAAEGDAEDGAGVLFLALVELLALFRIRLGIGERTPRNFRIAVQR